MRASFAVLSMVISAVLLSSCADRLSLRGDERALVKPQVTQKFGQIIFPDDNPSIADGKKVWEDMNCASCHGSDGGGVIGKADGMLKDAEFMSDTIPMEQYRFLLYGKRGISHPLLKDKLTVRQAWDLVFYVRSLAAPPLSEAEMASIDPVFGANCAVCHGKRGYGDGPLAHNLEPLVANFHQYNRFFDRDDAMLANHIAEGVYPSAMPGFWGRTDSKRKVKFDDAYIAKLVQYVRAFAVNKQSSALTKID